MDEQIKEEQDIREALVEMKTQKRRERVWYAVIFGGTVLSMVFAYNIWQSNANATTTDYYSGATPTSYTDNLVAGIQGQTGGPSVGAGGCCGGAGSATAGTAVAPSGGGCGSSAGGGCGTSSATAAPIDTAQVESLARQFYTQNYGSDKGLDFKVQNFGCHIQIDVTSAGKLVKTLIYRGGRFE